MRQKTPRNRAARELRRVRGSVDTLDARQIAQTAFDGTRVVTALPNPPATLSVVGGIRRMVQILTFRAEIEDVG